MKLIKPNYDDSIMAVSNSFLKYHNIPTNYNSQVELDKILLDKKPNHIIYILLDGMGLNIINHFLKEDDALRKYCVKGITSVFPPTTVAATNAVISGVPPIVNGYLGWVQYFEKEDVNLTVFQNTDFYDPNRTIEKHLQTEYLKRDSILDKIQKSTTVKTNILFPSFMPNGSDTFMEEIEKVLIINDNTDSSFTYMYWTQPDIAQHVYGIHSDEVKKILLDLNDDFTELINNVSDDTVVVCIADHGLTDIKEIPLYEYTKLNDMMLRKPSIEPRAINFFVKPVHIHEFKVEFEKNFSKSFDLLSKKELLESKLFGEGTPHPLIDSFLGDYIGLAKDKYMFALTEGKSYEAHHAGMTEDEMIVPLIVFSKKG